MREALAGLLEDVGYDVMTASSSLVASLPFARHDSAGKTLRTPDPLRLLKLR